MFSHSLLKPAFLFSLLFIALACDKESEEPTSTANSKPTAPTELKATATQTNIKLNWKASTDKDGKVASYAISHKLKTAKEYGKETTTTKTEHNITSLKADTEYSIRVRAKDDKGLFGDYATLPTVKTLKPATTNQPPTAPTNLKATATKTSLKVSWTASTDPDGKVAAYQLSFKEKAATTYGKDTSLTTTTLTLSKLKLNTDYSVRVRAQDDKGTFGDYTTLEVKTLSNQVPTPPTDFKSTDITLTTTKLSWTASTDPDGTVSAYLLSFKEKTAADYSKETTLTTTEYELTNLKPTTDYDIRLRAKDNQNALSSYATLAVKTLTPSPTAPAKPTDFAVDGSVSKTQTSLGVKWTAAQAAAKTTIAGYELSYKVKGAAKYGDPVAVTTLKHTLSSLTHSTIYSIRVRAKNDKDEYSDYATLEAATHYLPTAPTALKATAKTLTSLTLGWTASTDSDGTVASYGFSFKEASEADYGSEVSITTTSQTIQGLTAGTPHNIRVRAKDNHGNWSEYATLTVSTQSKPTAPANLAASARGLTSLTLAWGASTDADGTVASYALSYKETSASNYGSETTVTTPHTLSGLRKGAAYNIRLRAKDNDNHWGDYAMLTVSTQSDPTAPTNLTATDTTHTSISISWRASSDPDGTIAAYLVSYKKASEADYGSETSVTTTTHTITGLTGSTDYNISLRAKDNDGNYSDYSTTLNVTTKPAPVPFNFSSYGTGTFNAINATTDGYLIAGNTSDNKGWVVKIDKNGKELKNLKGYGDGSFRRITPTTDGNYLIVGTTSTNQGWVVKVDKDGTALKNLKGYGAGSFSDITATTDGNYLIVGTTSTNQGWVVKVDKDGAALKNLKGYGDGNFSGITATTDGNYLIAGDSSNKGWVVKIDKDGSVVDSKNLKTYGDGSFTFITKTPDDNYIVSGHSGVNGWAVKIDKEGAASWNKNYTSNVNNKIIDVLNISIPTSAGYIFTGGTVARNISKTIGFMIATDGTGSKELWRKDDIDSFSGFISTPDGNYLLVGGDNTKALVRKIDKDGNILKTD